MRQIILYKNCLSEYKIKKIAETSQNNTLSLSLPLFHANFIFKVLFLLLLHAYVTCDT